MNEGIDEYLTQVVRAGDEISSQLEKLFAPTMKNCPEAEVLLAGTGGIKIIRPPQGMMIMVHSSGGPHVLIDPQNYVGHASERLLRAAEEVGATPVALANVIDAKTVDIDTIMPYAQAIANEAQDHNLAVMNGEFAVLGNRMEADANVSLTMVSYLESQQVDLKRMVFETKEGIRCAIFNPKGKPIYLNSDGVGTKMECHERNHHEEVGLIDSLAMKLDDRIKIGAYGGVVSDIIESNNRPFLQGLPLEFRLHQSWQDFIHLIQPEYVAERINSWKKRTRAVNISGTAVSILDEEYLKHPPKPSAGETLLAIRGQPNPRSNGITDKRKALVTMYGNEWHTTPEGKEYLKFMATPSTIFYPVFREAILTGLATSVYHMSGGAFNGKLARPLAKHNLHVTLQNLYDADPRELALGRALSSSPETLYGKWPMGNEGFISTNNPQEVLQLLNKYHLEGRIIGILEEARGELTGVTFKDIKDSQGKQLSFNGRN